MPRPQTDGEEPRNGPPGVPPPLPPSEAEPPDPLAEAEALRALLHDVQLRLGRRGQRRRGEGEVYSWFGDYGQDCYVANRDVPGGHAPHEAIRAALPDLALSSNVGVEK